MTDTVLDAELRREVYRQRFASYLVNQYVKTTMQDLSRSIPAIISEYEYPNISRRELNTLSAAIRAEMTPRQVLMWNNITDELRELGLHEADAFAELYSDFSDTKLTVPSETTLVGAMSAGIMTLASGDSVRSGVWSKFVSDNNTATNRLIDGIIQVGWQEGFTTQEVTRQIRGQYNRQTKQYTGGILQGRATQWSETLARTGVSHYAAVARDNVARANSDIMSRRVLIATLDNRTTLICRSRHLQEWDISDDKYPRLPFHFNERSVYVFLAEGEEMTGTIVAVGGRAKNAKDYIETPRYRGKRDSDIYDTSQVSANVSMGDWLKRQPAAFVRSALGETRAKLFLRGGLSIDSFVDMQGNPLTLAELRLTSAGERAFRRAGVD